ncbi:hypothetical protein TTHERM_00085640 (macronuclear) [Tetrahymena thermophila SB210]|uniref:Transmembrane protein n=1 Tax=Tetrahymena thermophila (strain SB210) TaxID=312017 RepID=Q236N4_TETTS|nr:hypothetical protein TTHERM_00085640 [Tetrahymena thermophila SB210]EAR92466.2 hypothetical protein TTHERM_00085640 [Tetrahymena thermophila SB210]|eukprot:XP_001012711.2 hypothetical protein TTHERM_00085640 [Tetrahymena thermophila SB210]
MNIKYCLFIQVLIFQVKSQFSDACQELSTFFDSENNECKKCGQSCSICASDDKCIQCQQDYYLNQQGKCLNSCEEGQLKGLINQKCYQPPDLNCYAYDQQNYCSLCYDGYILNQNGICKNELCSQFQGLYDQHTKKCSLDEFYISDQSFEQQNNANSSQSIQNQFNFQYSSLKDDLNEQIVEIIALEVLNYKIVIGRMKQYLIFYDHETMSALQSLDMQAPITQIEADEQQLKLYVLVQHSKALDFHSYVIRYVLNTLISIDLVSYEQNIIVQYKDIIDEAFFSLQYFIIRQQNNLIIILLEDLTTKMLKTQNQITNIYFLQNEGIILFQDKTKKFYLTNPLFTAYNQISENFQEIIGLNQILKQSFIIILQKTRRGEWQKMMLYTVQKQIDDTNQIRYVLQEIIHTFDQICYDTKIYTTKTKDLMYIHNCQTIEIWRLDQMLSSINVFNNKNYSIQDDCIIVLFEQQIAVYLNPERGSQMTIQTYNINFSYLTKSIQIPIQNIIKIMLENENLYIINQNDPQDIQQLQFITLTPHEKQECTIYFPKNSIDSQNYDFSQVQIANNLIAFTNFNGLIVFNYNCSMMNLDDSGNIYLTQLKEISYDYAVSNFIIQIFQQTLQYIDMSYPYFSYQSITFYDEIQRVEEVQGSDSLLLVRFNNDVYNAVLFNCYDNTQIHINKQIGNIMYFKSDALFMSYPQNQLLVYQVQSRRINQNIFYNAKQSFLVNSENQQVIGETYQQIIFIQSLTDGSIKQYQTEKKNHNPTNIVENSSIYITLQSYNTEGKSFLAIDVKTDKSSFVKQIKSYKLLQNGDNFLIIVVSTTNNWTVLDKKLNSLGDLAKSIKGYSPSLLWKEKQDYYYISLSFNMFTIFDMQGLMISEQNLSALDVIKNKQNIILFQADQIAQYSLNVRKKKVTLINSFQINSSFKQFNIDSQNNLIYIQFETKFIALQIDTLQLVQEIEIQINYIFLGSDLLNQVQIFRQQNTIIILQLQNEELKSIPVDIDLSSKSFFIDSELGILVITENISNQIYLLTYIAHYQFNSFQIDVNSNDLSLLGITFNYNYHLSVLTFGSLYSVQLVDVNYFFYQTQKIKIAPDNQSSLVGLNNEKVMIINNDIKYLTVFDNKSQKLEDSLLLDEQMDFSNIENYQIVNFKQYYENVHSIYVMGMKDNLFAYFLKIFEMQTNVQNTQSQVIYIKTVVVKTSSIIDNYKHIIMSSQITSSVETLRYQVYYQPPTTINQFPVINNIKTSLRIQRLVACSYMSISPIANSQILINSNNQKSFNFLI